MSWVTDLVGKAENILNKIDAEAKTVLSERRGSSAPKDHVDGFTSLNAKDSGNALYGSSSLPSNLSSYGVSSTSEQTTPDSDCKISGSLHGSPKYQKISRQKKNLSVDASFMSFLNADQALAKSSDTNTSVSASGHSRDSSISSLSSYIGLGGRDTPGAAMMDAETGSVGSASGASANNDAYITVETPSDVAISAPSSDGSNSSTSTTSPPVIINMRGSPMGGSLEGETEMLRKELNSLNQEMAHVLRRAKQAEKELKTLRSERSESSSQQNKLIRELQQVEADMQETINAKDSQLAVLRVRLQEADEKIQINLKTLDQMKTDNNRLLDGANMSSGLHSQAINTLEERLAETKSAFEREKEQNKSVYNDLVQRISQLEEERQSMVSSMGDAQKKLQAEKTKTSQLHQQILSLKGELSVAREELSDYKQKAMRILQSKDKLISSLKGGSTSDDDDLNNQELEQIRSERDLLQEELEVSRTKIRQLTVDLSELEILSQNESQSAAESLADLEQELTSERANKTQIEEEQRHAKEELRCVHEELTKQKVNFSTRIQEREFEIEKLQKQVAHRQSSSSTQGELENRLRGLTESLIHKQTTIETLSTEKQSLLMQMERLQAQYKESQDMLNSDQPISYHQEELRNRVPTFMIESPFDGGVTRRVKRAYSTFDKFSVRLGVFLRRYPIARIFVIFYMFLLHLWVMVVLLTYTPEIHGPEFHSKESGPFPP